MRVVARKLLGKISLPIIDGSENYGQSGQVLVSNGDGTFSWQDISTISTISSSSGIVATKTSRNNE